MSRQYQFDEQQLEAIRADMLRFARLQLKDSFAAEDAVQEALLAAYSAKDRFQGKAQLKTWIFAILRNKIIDLIRQNIKKTDFQEYNENEQEPALFDQNGHWLQHTTPKSWPQPEQSLLDDHFWKVFQLCIHHLPETTSQVFSMREFLGLKTSEICHELGIKENHCWVILHRARNQLRICLEKEWMEN